MNEKVETAVRSVLKLDPEFDAAKAEAAIDVLKGRTLAAMRKVERLDPVIKRKEAAKLLKVGVHRVDELVREGKLRRMPPGAKRASGISTESVLEYQGILHDEEMRRLK